MVISPRSRAAPNPAVRQPPSPQSRPHLPTSAPSANSASELGARIAADVSARIQEAMKDGFDRARSAPPIDLSGGARPAPSAIRPGAPSPIAPAAPSDAITGCYPRPAPAAPTADGTPPPSPASDITIPEGSSSDVTDFNAASIVDAPITSAPGSRSADAYDATIDQFDVEGNPRYSQRDGNTYCNIFASDVTRAMGAPIPHWVDGAGQPTEFGVGHELDANMTNDWLNQHGAEQGWREVSAEEAQRLANEGNPAVASWNNPGGIGHIGVIRPGEMGANGPALAQAGQTNDNDAHVYDYFPTSGTEYWVNDAA